VPTDAATQHPAACERDRVQRLLQQQTRSSSLLQLDMDTKQVRFDPLAREIDPELLTVMARQESARSTNVGSMSQMSANNSEQSVSASMVPNGNGSGSRNNSTNEMSGVGSGRIHGMNKEFPLWDCGRSVHVKAQALWRHVNSALVSVRGFRVHLGSGSGVPLLDIGCVVFSTAGITLFIFCVLAEYSDETPNVQKNGMEKLVKKRASGTCLTHPEPSPRLPLACRHDLAKKLGRAGCGVEFPDAFAS